MPSSTAFIEQVPVASHNDDDGADDDMEQVSLASVQLIKEDGDDQ